MTDDAKLPAPEDDDTPPAPELDALPPIDGGDPEPALDDRAFGVEPDDEASSALAAGAEDDDLDEVRLRAFAEELDDFEPPFPGGDEPADEIGREGLDALDEEVEWGDDDGPAAPLDDTWFENEPDPGALDDDGAEGLLAPEEEHLPEPPPEPDLGPDEDLAADGGADAEGDDVGAPGELEARYLGPARGLVTGVAFVDGAPLAAGDGLYRLGADGLLHRYDAEEEIGAIAIAAAGDDVFIGTAQRGLLRARGFGGALAPLGVPRSLRGQDDARDGTIAFRLFALLRGGGVRLVGLTGGGRLLSSDDGGASWSGLAEGTRCTAACPVEGEDGLLALAVEAGGAFLLALHGDGQPARIALPDAFAAAALESPINLAAGGGVVALAVDRPGTPLLVSIDRGARFSEIRAVVGVTALAVDPREPGWIAAAQYRGNSDLGTIRTSRDGGATWRTAFTVGRAEEREERDRGRGRVASLAVVGEDARLLVAVAGDGVYTAPLPGRRAPH